MRCKLLLLLKPYFLGLTKEVCYLLSNVIHFGSVFIYVTITIKIGTKIHYNIYYV